MNPRKSSRISKENIRKVLKSLLRENKMALFLAKLITKREELKFLKFIIESKSPFKDIIYNTNHLIKNIDNLNKRTSYYFPSPEK